MSSKHLTALVIGAGAAFGLLGAYSSFEAVNARMEPSFGHKAWIVPIGVDLGIALAAAGDLWMASRNQRTWWLRYIPHAFSAGTIYLNVVGERSLEGRVGHALMVFLWIAFVSAVAHVVKLQAVGRRDRGQRQRLDRIRLSRYLLAPWSTLQLRRRMILWEVHSYPEALQLERERQLGRCDLQDAHGALAWRWRAPRRDRVEHRLGRIAPAAGKAPKAPKPAPSPARALPTTSNGDSGTTAAELIAQQMHNNGEKVTRRSLTARVRAEGHTIGTKKATELAGQYR